MEKDRLAAGIRKDLAFYDSTTAADYLQIDLNCQILDKPTMLDRVKSSYAELDNRSNCAFLPSMITCDKRCIRSVLSFYLVA